VFPGALNASGWQFAEIKPPATQLFADFRSSSDPVMVIRNGEKRHYYADFTGAPDRFELGPGVGAGHSAAAGSARDSFLP